MKSPVGVGKAHGFLIISKVGKIMIIALEGIDGAGKSVQSEILIDALGRSNCLGLSFPDYDSFLGRHIGALLGGQGEATAQNVDPHSMALWFATERLQCIRRIDITPYKYVVLNRYTPSNAVYQSLRLPVEMREDFVEWVFTLEYEVFGLPRPNLTLILDIDEALSTANISKKGFRSYTGDTPDLYENTNTLASARTIYTHLSKTQDNYALIPCMANTTAMRSPRDIHREILRYVE